MAMDVTNDPEELQALFDSVAAQNAVTASAGPAAGYPAPRPVEQAAPEPSAERMLAGIGHLTARCTAACASSATTARWGRPHRRYRMCVTASPTSRP